MKTVCSVTKEYWFIKNEMLLKTVSYATKNKGTLNFKIIIVCVAMWSLITV